MGDNHRIERAEIWTKEVDDGFVGVVSPIVKRDYFLKIEVSNRYGRPFPCKVSALSNAKCLVEDLGLELMTGGNQEETP